MKINKEKYFYLLAFGLILLLCLPLLINGNWFAGDILYEFYYNRAYGFSELKKGDIPLWNPYQFCGTPFLDSLQSGLFYPGNVIFMILPLSQAFVLTVIMHLFFAWWFMYLLLKNLFNDNWSAFVGGVVFMLCGALTAHIYAGHITYLNAYPFIPLVFYFYRIGFIKMKLSPFIYAGAVVGVQFLTGYPQICLFTFYMVLAYFIYKTIQLLKAHNNKLVINSLLFGFISGIVCLMITSVQLLPALLFSRFSGRAGGVQESFATSYSLPPENTLTMIFPHLFGNGVEALNGTNVSYFGRWLPWEILPYAGLICILFLACTFSRELIINFQMRLVGLLSLIALLLAYGQYGYFYTFVYKYIPGFNLFRVPGRLLIPFSFGLCILVGYFLANNSFKDIKPVIKRLMIGTVLLGLLTIFLQVMLANQSDGQTPFWKLLISYSAQYDDAHLDSLPINDVNFLKSSYQFVINQLSIGLFFLIILFILLGSIRVMNLKTLYRYGLGLFLIFDLLFFSHIYFKGGKGYTSDFPEGVRAKLTETGVQRIASKSETEYLSVGSLYNIAHVGGYDPAQLKIYTEFINALSGRKTDEELVISEPIKPGNLLPLMSVSHVLVQKGMQPYPGAELVGNYDNTDLYKLKRTLPRSFFAKGFTVIDDKEKRLKTLSENYLISGRVILNYKPKEEFSIETSEIDEDKITWESDTPHRIELKTNNKVARLLILNDANYPLWKVKVNGNTKEIYTANHLFRAVVVPAGENTVVFYYNKKPFYLGLGLSVFGLLIIFGFLFNDLIQNKKLKAENTTKMSDVAK